MDISLLTSLPLRHPEQRPIVDLLGQLKAAGKIDAEVARLLADGLLLNTRLGQIRTSNRLHLRQGDQVKLRLQTGDRGPVLKVSVSSTDKAPQTIDLKPLKQILPTERAEIARVLSVSTKQIKIEIGQQRIVIPRLPQVEKGQLLLLQRNARQDAVDVRTLDRQSVYQAVVKQLLPRQVPLHEAPLTRLLNHLAQPGQTVKVPNAPPSNGTSMPGQSRDRNFVTASPAPASKPLSASATPMRSANNQAKPLPAGSRPSLPGQTASIPVAVTRSRPFSVPVTSTPPPSKLPVSDTTALPANRVASDTKPNPVQNTAADTRPVRPSTDPKGSQIGSVISKPGLPVLPAKPSTHSNQTVVARSKPAAAYQPAVKLTAPDPAPSYHQPVTRAADVAQPATPNPDQNRPPHAQPSTAVPIPTRNRSATSPTPNTVVTDPLKNLFQVVPKLADFGPSQVKQWFSFLGLLQTPAPVSSSKTPDPFTILRHFVHFGVVEPDPVRAKSSGPAGDEATGRRGSDEMFWLTRDSLKLLDQALVQNTLQRASFGLQQEAQQPLNLSFALPLQDGHEFKSLYIEIRQQSRSTPERNETWEIRISFDFEGLGEISCHITLDQERVGASFYCVNDLTQVRVQENLPELRRHLAQAGFEIGELNSYAMRCERSGTNPVPCTTHSLIDIEV